MATELRKRVQQLFRKLSLTELQAKDLEIGIYNWTIDYAKANNIPLSWSADSFNELYLAKARSMHTNLKCPTSNLLQRLKKKEHLPHELPALKPEELYPEVWKEILDKESKITKNAYENNMVAMTDRYTCPKCKYNKTSYVMFQKRSADEPMAMLTTCLKCFHKWSM
jgi:DNA-directed RNA polymerase subunit M/transcription elongation factor TFIIS